MSKSSCATVRRCFFDLCDSLFGSATARRPGNAQTLIPGISYSPHRNPEAWECASASGFFFGFWFAANVFIFLGSSLALPLDRTTHRWKLLFWPITCFGHPASWLQINRDERSGGASCARHRGDRDMTKLLTRDEVRRIAVNIAKLPELLSR